MILALMIPWSLFFLVKSTPLPPRTPYCPLQVPAALIGTSRVERRCTRSESEYVRVHVYLLELSILLTQPQPNKFAHSLDF